MTTATELLVQKAKEAQGLPPPAERAAIRTAAGLSQREVGRALGDSGTCINFWEQGTRHPTGPNVLAYGQLLRDLRAVVGGRP